MNNGYVLEQSVQQLRLTKVYIQGGPTLDAYPLRSGIKRHLRKSHERQLTQQYLAILKAN